MKRLGIVDYGAGNLHSVRKAFAYLGAETEIITAPPARPGFDALVLPGVGNFGEGMAELERRDFPAFIAGWTAQDRPFLGICLGLQFLFEESEECPGIRGLGLLKGGIRRFPQHRDRKVPQIGWNTVVPADPANPLFRGLPESPHFYFVHSYYCLPEEAGVAACTTEYGFPYCSGVRRGNLFATQFHPEKSQENGLRMLSNFLNLN